MSQDSKLAKPTGVTRRAVLLGLLILPLHVYWVITIEVRWYVLDSSCLPLFVTPVFILFVLVLGNMLWGRLRPGTALGQGELLTVYIMQVMAMTMAGHDSLQNLMGTITGPAWRALNDPGLRWPQTFYQYLNRALFVWDEPSLRRFFLGNSTAYRWDNVRPWLMPLFWWTTFVMVMVAMFLAMNVILRRAWTEQEKLAFPIIQLPLAITERGARTPFFSSKLMWMGFLVAGGINTLNGLYYMFPALPYIPVRIADITIKPTEMPWKAAHEFPLSFYPFAIGIAYFLPLDLSFSCWFFFLFRKLQMVGGAAMGFDPMVHDFPYIAAQTGGAWVGFALLVVWSMRRYLREVWQTALGRKPARPGVVDDSREPVRYRTALIILGLGAIYLVLWGRATHMPVLVVFLFFGVVFLLGIALTRVRAELGAPHEITYSGFNPQIMMVSMFGAELFGPAALTGMTVVYWFNRGYRNHAMPNQLEAFKMADVAKMDPRRLFWVMLLALGVAIVATYWAHMHICYQDGARAKVRAFKLWGGTEGFPQLQNWIESGSAAQRARQVATGAGVGLVCLLRFMRIRYLWWPFHPAGYALGMSFAMDYFWFAFFVSWLIKLTLVHYGGMRIHRAAIPFFLGLILGDYVTGSLWSIYGPLQGVNVYKIFIKN